MRSVRTRPLWSSFPPTIKPRWKPSTGSSMSFETRRGSPRELSTDTELSHPRSRRERPGSRGGCTTGYVLSSRSRRCLGVSQLSVLPGRSPRWSGTSRSASLSVLVELLCAFTMTAAPQGEPFRTQRHGPTTPPPQTQHASHGKARARAHNTPRDGGNSFSKSRT